MEVNIVVGAGGLVAKIMVKPGDKVAEKDEVAIVEPNKWMPARIRTHVAGVVKEILVKENDTIPTGAILAVIETE